MNKFYANLNSKKKRGYFSLFLATFFLSSIRFLYFGFKYFPQLDDYIQHHNYALLGNFFEVIEKFGLLGARPLAGILDITLWTWLWPCEIVGVLLVSATYAFSAIEFAKIFDKVFGTSGFFIVIYSLLPLGIEGTYWMSASTRIVPGMLFVALSASSFVNFLEKGQKRKLLIALLYQFFTFCFYEQTAVLSCALNIILALIFTKTSNKRWTFSFGCVACAALYFALTALQADSILYSGRTSIILPKSEYYFDTFLPDLLSQIKTAFFDGGYYTLVYGFLRGLMRIFNDGAWIYCVIVLIGCAWLGFLFVKRDEDEFCKKKLLELGCGAILLIAPLAPFFIIDNPWFSLRGTVSSFVGLALVLDSVLRAITKNKTKTIAVLSSIVAFIFCLCSVSELADYKETNEADMRVVSSLSDIAQEIRAQTTENCKVAVLNVEPRYVTEQNFYYHEHIHGVTQSDWALTGAIRCYNENVLEGITYVPISLSDEMVYRKWEYSAKSIGGMHSVYVYSPESDSVERLNVKFNDNVYQLYYLNGEKFGTIVENDGCGFFTKE